MGYTPQIKGAIENAQKTPGTAVGTFSSQYYGVEIKSKKGFESATDAAYKFVKQNYKEGGQVVLFGYSYGANFLNTLSERLEKDGIKVTLSIVVDAAAGKDTKDVDRSVDENTEENVTIYQTQPEVTEVGSVRYKTGSYGGPSTAKDDKKTKVSNYNYTGYFTEDANGNPVPVTHSNIHKVSLGHYIQKIVEAIDRENKKKK